MGPIGCPETSVRDYQYKLRNNPEESRFETTWEFRIKLIRDTLPVAYTHIYIWVYILNK